ncbi:MAG: undecaprenyl-diphosphate phosphatase [Pseudomonadota bacterium]
MTWLQTVVLAIVQGLTEFLPISSSGHLVLAPVFFGWPDQGLAFDVAVHFGTLAGVLGYFYRDLLGIGQAFFTRSPAESTEARMGWLLIVATVPVGLVGLLAHDWISTNLRSAAVIAISTAVFGIVLWLADVFGSKRKEIQALTVKGAVLMGLAQAIALIPGTSRSGITMTAALALGLTRTAAAKFSFLMSVPVIVLAAGLETKNLVASGLSVDWGPLITGAAVSGLVAYLTIRFFLKFVEGLGMAPFAWYRLALAAVIWFALV